MEDSGTSPKRRKNRPLLIGLVLIGAVVLAIAIGGSISGWRNSGVGTTSKAPTYVAEAPQTDAFGFGNDQNDATGYDGNKWGISFSTFLGKRVDLGTSDNIITGQNGHVPDDFAGVLSIPMVSTEKTLFKNGYNWSVVPEKFQEILTDHTHRFFDNSELTCGFCPDYVFYNNELAMVIVPMDNANYAPVLQDFATKYQQVGGDVERWNGATDMRIGSGANITLFKRGNSNTRIYLIQNLDDHGNPDTEYTGLFAIYVPTYYLWAIQHDIQGKIDYQSNATENAADSKRAAAREQEQKHLDEDLVKIQ